MECESCQKRLYRKVKLVVDIILVATLAFVALYARYLIEIDVMNNLDKICSYYYWNISSSSSSSNGSYVSVILPKLNT
jgi:hypothetical protein